MAFGIQQKPAAGKSGSHRPHSWRPSTTVTQLLCTLTVLLLTLDCIEGGHFYTVNRQKALQRFGKRWSSMSNEATGPW
ncbi:unnamed protein product, partial [Notodromas monacha]